MVVRMLKKIVLLFTVLNIWSCVQDKKIQNTTEIKTAGVRSINDELSVIGGVDRGEFLIGAPAAYISVQVTNSSNYIYKNLSLTIDQKSTAGVKFAPDSIGISRSPGQGGTCKLDLAKGESCIYVLQFTPNNMGNIFQDVYLTYSNIIEPVKKKLRMNFVVGDYPNIVEVNEKIRHDFGTIERMDQYAVFEKDVELVNVGGLTARNLKLTLSNLVEGAYSISKNTCPSDLPSKASCKITIQLKSQNYLVTDLPRTYTTDLAIDYLKNPASEIVPERGRYQYSFSVYSAKVEGVLAVSGSPGFAFPKLVHGNKAEVEFKVKNNGIKDIILRKILVYDQTMALIATCQRVDNLGKIECLDGSLNPIPLMTFPFGFKDIDNCLVNFKQDGDYQREGDTGNFIGYTPKVITHPTDTILSGTCAFKASFHSSINHLTNVNFNNWSLGFEFDNGFKNVGEIITTTPSLGARFTITLAEGRLGSKLKINRYTRNTINVANPPSPYVFDVGKVAVLQSDSTYRDLIKFSLLNENTLSPWKLIQVRTETDTLGSNFLFNNSARTVNSYFTSTYLATCRLNTAYTSSACELVTFFAPKLPKDFSKVVGPTAFAASDNKRKFTIVYNDGCSINDDGTPCSNKVLEAFLQVELVERASLQYNTAKSGGGSGALPLKYNVGTTLVSGKPLVGSETWYYLWLDNIGTGALTYLKTVTGAGFLGNNITPLPFAIVPDATGLGVGESDCADYLRGNPLLNDDFPLLASMPSINFPAATKCRLKVESMIYPNEVVTSYSTREWRREFYQSRTDNREYIYQAARNENLLLDFYDGDLSYETEMVKPSNYQSNYGLRTTILGGSNGRFLFKSAFAYPGKLIPMTPTPMVSSVLYRPAFSSPAILQHPNSRLPAVGVLNMPAHVLNLQAFTSAADSYTVTGSVVNVPSAAFPTGGGYTGLPAVGTREAFSYLNTLYPFTNYSGYDYVFYAGAFPVSASETYQAGFILNNFGYGMVTNLVETFSCDMAPQGCMLTANTIRRNTDPILSSLSMNSTSGVGFWFTPTSVLDVGLHEATLTLDFKNPEIKQLKIKIIFNVIPENAKRVQVIAEDFECNFGVDPNCLAPTAVLGTNDISSLFQTTKLPNTLTSMVAVAGSPIGARKKLTITNTGTDSITDVRVYFKSSASSTTPIYNDPLGYSVSPIPAAQTAAPTMAQYQCQSVGQTGILLSGDACNVNIKFSPIAANSLPVVLVISYRVLDGTGIRGVYVNKLLDLYMVGDNQANLVIDGQPAKSFAYTVPSTVQSYAMKFGNFINSNHPVLVNYPKTQFDSNSLINSPALELFNQRSEKASLLAQYEDYANSKGLPLTPPFQAWTRIYESPDLERYIEVNQGCFYGNDYSNGSVPLDQKGFYSNDQGTSTGCQIRLIYDVGINKRGIIDSKNTIIPIKYYSTRRLLIKTVYLHVEGFVEPFRSQNATGSINDVKTTDQGTLELSWNNFLDESAVYGDVHRYRVYYSKFASDLVKMYESTPPSSLMFTDTTGIDNSVYISDLEPGRFYYFQVVAMRRTDMGNPATEYISMPESLYRKKILVPPSGFGFDYLSQNLIEKSLQPFTGDLVTKSEAQTFCSSKNIALKDEGSIVSKMLQLISEEVYDNVIMEEADTLINNGGNPSGLYFSDHNFLDEKTWLSDTKDISTVFTPTYDCSQAVGFNDDNTQNYIKSCDNNNPLTLCCNINTLNQIRGLPLPSSPTIHTMYSNLSGVKAQYRCFVKLSL